MTVGFYIGRFQPLHNGHLKALSYVLDKSEQLVVGIGTSQKSHTPNNPFTFGERKEMIESALSGYADRIKICAIPDFKDDKRWISYIRENLPRFDIVYSNAGRELSLFSGNRFMVEEIPFFDRGTYSATEVRKRMISGENWRELLPKETIEVINRIGGVARVKRLSKKSGI